MATDIVKDYLGHPCRVTMAIDRYGEAMNNAAKEAAKEPRATAASIGREILEVGDRMDTIHDALGAALEMLSKVPDSERVEAVLRTVERYSLETCNGYFSLAGATLHALKQGGLHVDRRPVEHKQVEGANHA